METIVKYYGDERTKAAHKSGTQGALFDVENLCSVSTGGLLDRFRDWLMFESPDVKVIINWPARSQWIPPSGFIVARSGISVIISFQTSDINQ